MTEKTTPHLPYALGEFDSPGALLDLAVTRVMGSRVEIYARRHFKDEMGGHAQQGGGFFDPVELMRGLALFVPEVEPVAWLDKSGTAWTHSERQYHAVGWSRGENPNVYTQSMKGTTLEGSLRLLKSERGPLTPIYAHPPVTAEPAFTPRANLWPNPAFQVGPGGWGPVVPDPSQASRIARDSRLNGRTIRQWMEAATALQERAEKAEARVKELEVELEEANEARINLANRVTEVENIARAEVERHKSEAARQERRAEEWKDQWRFVLEGAMQETAERIELDLVMQDIKGDTGRAAVETGEEAGP